MQFDSSRGEVDKCVGLIHMRSITVTRNTRISRMALAASVSGMKITDVLAEACMSPAASMLPSLRL